VFYSGNQVKIDNQSIYDVLKRNGNIPARCKVFSVVKVEDEEGWVGIVCRSQILYVQANDLVRA